MEGDAGLDVCRQEFAKVGAWPESIGKGGPSGAFNAQVYNPAHHSNAAGMQTSGLSYTRALSSKAPVIGKNA